MRIVLGYPPSVSWRGCVLPWFSVRALSVCPRGAAMPLGASVLRCSWSSRGGHLSQVRTVFFLSPRSYRRLSLLLVGLVPGLGRVLPPQAGAVFFGHALVLVAISYVFLRDVVTLWVNSVFLSLLIANEGLLCWLFLFRYSHPY